MTRRYDAAEIEPKWQATWAEEGLYRAVDDPADTRPRFFALDMFPYPSGDLHMGHAEAFSGGDAVARYHAMRGANVLHPIGWDAFGLPAENAAIKRGAEPAEWTYANIEQQAASFDRMGMSFDWSRRLATCDPDYYRWTQWLFLRFFERGLAYRRRAPVNWCPKDATVLANEQVIGGACERCGTPVERRELTQWFFKITDYADRLLDDAAHLVDWPDRVLTMQRNWIGRSHGAEVTFAIEETGEEITIFTTRPDTLWGATFFVFAVEHPAVQRLAELGGMWDEVEPLVRAAERTSLVEREAADTKEGVFLGVHAVNPVNGEKIPCYAAPYVLMGYGTGAIMAVPAHDQRDFDFARQHGVEVRVVVQPPGQELDGATMTEAFAAEGELVRSGPFDGRPTPDSIGEVIAWLEGEGRGRAAVNYRLHDWLVSRQRSWGPPIPIVHCPDCGEVPVPDDQLPVELPSDLDFTPGDGGESPLARHSTWKHVTCPSCGGAAERDTDTLDTFVDSSWYFFRYCSPGYEDGPFRSEDVNRWMPVGQYTGGVEHAILHLLYSRFFTKVLYDMGMVDFAEPFPRLMNQGQVIYDGGAMSKSKGNIVEPLPLVERWGADTMRLMMLFAGPFEDDIDWKLIAPDPDKRPGVHQWLGRVVAAVSDAVAAGDAQEPEALVRRMHKTIKGVTEDMDRFRFNTAISKLMVLTNEIRAAVDAGAGARTAAAALTQMLAPLAPFAAEELWRVELGHATTVHRTDWPTYDASLAADETVTLVVQVNGKVRDKIEVPADIGEAEALTAARESAGAQRALEGHEVAREIVRAPKLVNFVVNR
jgi:leucyl-tRNA synthetase